MEARYVIAGAIGTVVSSVFAVYALLSGNSMVLGVSLSTLILGITVLTLGLTYVEPLGELLKKYSKDMNMLVTRFLEDSGIIGNYRFKLCVKDGKYYAVYSSSNVKCGNVNSGVGVSDSAVYLAIPLTNLSLSIGEAGEAEEIPNIRDYLESILTKTFNICRSIVAKASGKEVHIELIALSREAVELMRSPVNPVRATVALAVSKYFRKPVEIAEEDIVENNYTVKLKVVGD